ncbi:hypothetical protein [Streptomyces sp. NPDC056045]|uniref:hypothetical protein n=1 Tax=Streptomyces sp. NPDC056045 TaxID=3345691 RepID=UPI0035E16751
MPSIVHELSGHRDVEGLRAVVKCPAKATVLREGPAQESGPCVAWLAYLCPAHAAELDGWAGAADHPDTGTVPGRGCVAQPPPRPPARRTVGRKPVPVPGSPPPLPGPRSRTP